MRGAPSGPVRLYFMVRIIPADAGSTYQTVIVTLYISDHPRGCGEHSIIPWMNLSDCGSSPRMRGARADDAVVRQLLGIIPADAWSTARRKSSPLKIWDHPRGCGEHVVAFLAHIGHGGSSPRMRGAQQVRRRKRVHHGITPADAGSTFYLTEQARTFGDHPRGCGEHDISVMGRTMSSGSSPRMRGALRSGRSAPGYRRIIPADAGSTHQAHPTVDGQGDHPRGCGEHLLITWSGHNPSGSSPRMRGAQSSFLIRLPPLGIIPADAGSTAMPFDMACRYKDHPRGCGEHVSMRIMPVGPAGSSPRMRGALGRGKRFGAGLGIIPADAGSTSYPRLR